MAEARSEIVHVRLSAEERERLQRAAATDHLALSTWARQAILRALAQWESRRGLRVAERRRD
jgi:uncharacterized protein (DUF1778 family)